MNVLNESLLTKQKVTPIQEKELNILYDKINTLFLYEKGLSDKEIVIVGKDLALKLEELELELQYNWNFVQDKNFHTWWNRFSHCKCPKLDNKERFGLSKYKNSECPLHGLNNG